jgi:hypothetical protein
MNKKDIRKVIGAAIITGLGIIGLFGTLLSMPDNHKTLRIILIIISIVLLIVAIILYLSSYFDLKNAFQILRSTKKLGISAVNMNGISGDKFGSLLSESKNIKIISCSALIFLRTREDKLAKALENNARISIIIASPNSDFIKDTEAIESRNHGEIDSEIDQVKSLLSNLKQEVLKNTNNQSTGVVNIKHFRAQYRLPLIIIDDSVAWLTITLPPKKSTQSPSLLIRNVESGLLNNCVHHFDELWSQLDSTIDVPKVDFNSFLEGKWKLDWIAQEGDGSGSEYLEIKNGSYFVDNVFWFNLDQITFDYHKKKISFRKVAVKENDNRNLINDLEIDNDNKLIGFESGFDMVYYRL